MRARHRLALQCAVVMWLWEAGATGQPHGNGQRASAQNLLSEIAEHESTYSFVGRGGIGGTTLLDVLPELVKKRLL
jgi:hypothetical protein